MYRFILEKSLIVDNDKILENSNEKLSGTNEQEKNLIKNEEETKKDYREELKNSYGLKRYR